MSSSWWRLLNRGNSKFQLSAIGRRGQRHSKSRRPRFEPLEPRVLLAANPYISLQGGGGSGDPGAYVASSSEGSVVQIPVRIDNLQDAGTPQDVGLSFAMVALNYATTAPIQTAVESGATVEITTPSAHGFVAGESVNISGMTVKGYNGVFQIASVPSATTFTFTATPGLDACRGTAQATATASIFDLSQAPVVTWGPLVPSGWLTATGDDGCAAGGTVALVACNGGSSADVTTADPTNGGLSPDGDVLAYVTLALEPNLSVGASAAIQVDAADTSLVEDSASESLTGNPCYPTLDAPQNATVTIVDSSTGPVTPSSGGHAYTSPMDLTAGTTTSVTSSSASVAYGTSVTFTATVSAQSGGDAPSNGIVDFYDATAGFDLGDGNFNGSVGVASTWTLTTDVKTFNATPGDSIVASYMEDAEFTDSSGSTTQTVTALPITLTAAANAKLYDGTTSASALPTITSGSLVAGDTAAFSETYDDAALGTGKTLLPSGTVSDGNGGDNYSVTFVASTDGTIAVSNGEYFEITASPTSVVAGNSFTLDVTAYDANNNKLTDYAGTVQLTSSDPLEPSPAGTEDISFTAGSGTVSVPATLETAGAWTITVADTSSPWICGTSDPITVTAGPAWQLAFTSQPSNTPGTGTMAAVAVSVEDVYGNVVATDNSSVTVSLNAPASGGVGATLGGTVTVTAVDGVATFSDLSIGRQVGSDVEYSAAGTGYTFMATDGLLTSTDSDSFNTTLIVTNVAWNSTGFVATFSEPIDPSAVNVWGSQSSPSVSLYNTTGSAKLVRGSLVIDPTDTQITFVATTLVNNTGLPIASTNPSDLGVLPAGTYAATLYSGSAGFQTTTGQALDGTQDDSFSNYSTTYTVSSATDAVVLPGFARGPGNTVNVTNDAGSIAAASSTANLATTANNGATATTTTTNIAANNGATAVTTSASIAAAANGGASESGTNVTISTTTAHQLVVGQQVTIAGVSVSGYNGTFTVTSVPSTTAFTYTAAASGLAASGGGTVEGTIVTIKTTAAHKLLAGELAVVAGVGVSAYNGAFTVLSALSTSFTYSVAPQTLAASGGGSVEGTLVTITTTAASNVAAGQQATIAGVGVSAYNGAFTVLSVPSTTTFTYSVTPQTLAVSGGGTVTSYGVTDSNGVLTVRTTVLNGLVVGEPITIAGVGVGGYNGAYYIASKPGVGVFTVVGATGLATSGGGTWTAATGIPLSLTSADGVTSAQFDVSWDPTLLSVTGVAIDPKLYASYPGATLTFTPQSPGLALISFSSTENALPNSSNPILLGGLIATVPDAALYGSTDLLQVSDVSLSNAGGSVPSIGSEAMHVVAYLGDLDGDSQITPNDNTVFTEVVGSGTDQAYRLADPNIIGDLTGDGKADGAAEGYLVDYILSVASVPQMPAYLGAASNWASPTQVVMSSTSTVSEYGQSVCFTATVTSAEEVPDGSVVFWDGSTQLDTESISPAGTASYTTSSLDPGSHSITVSYAGDANYAGSTSDALPEIVADPVSNVATIEVDTGDTMTLWGIAGGVTIDVTGGGTLILTGNNSYTGGTIIDAGTVQVGDGGSAGTLGSGAVTDNSSLVFDYSGNLTVANAINGTGSLTQQGSGTLILAGQDDYAGETTVDAGTLQLGLGDGSGPQGDGGLTVAAGGRVDLAAYDAYFATLAGDGTIESSAGPATLYIDGGDPTSQGLFSGMLQDGPGGQLALNMQGAGTLTLAGQNTYTGGTIIDEGAQLQLGDGTATGSLGCGLVTDRGSLAFDFNGNVTVANTIVAAGSLTREGSGTVILAGDNNYSGGTTINDGTVLLVGDGAATGTLGSGLVTDNGSLVFGYSGNVTVANAISGAGSLTQQGSGILILAGDDNYTGQTTANAGTLQLGLGDGSGPAGDGGLTVAAGSTVDLAAYDAYFATLAGSGTIESSAGPATLYIDGTDPTSQGVFCGTLQDGPGGQLGLDMQGAGTLTLAGQGTYTGQTTVESGVLDITGSIAGPVTLDGGNLAGPGAPATVFVATSVSVASSASPSALGQSITLTATVAPSNAGYGTPTGTVDFYDDTTQSDLGSGTLTDGVATLSLSGLDIGDHYLLATYSGDTTFTQSEPAGLDQDVVESLTTVAVSISPSPTYGQPVTLTATVSPNSPGYGTPAGSVDFFDETTATDLGSVGLVNGVATLSVSSLAVGSNTISAVYSGSGDGTYGSDEFDCPINVAGDPLSLVNVSLYSGEQGVQGVVEGGVATLSGAIGGLDGVPFTVSVDWGQGQAPSSASFSPGSVGTSFNISHYYDDAGGTFASTFDPTVTVITSDGRSTTYDNFPTVQGVSPAPVVLISEPQQVDPGTSVTASATVNDPGVYETFTYSWVVWQNTTDGWQIKEVDSGSGPTISIPTNSSEAGYNLAATLQVTNAEGVTTVAESNVYVDPYGDPPIPSNLVLDTPTVTVTEIDPGATVVAGTPAQFDIHINSGSPEPMLGNVTVAYWTQDGSAIGSENATEQSPANYQSTGVQSHKFEAGETDTIITVPTYTGMTGGNFSLQVGNLYDPFAAPWYNGVAAVTAVAYIAPTNLNPRVVTSGDPATYDKNEIVLLSGETGPYVAAGTYEAGQVGAFPAGLANGALDYKMYTVPQPGGASTYYVHPYALTFDYPSDGTDNWTWQINEKKTLYALVQQPIPPLPGDPAPSQPPDPSGWYFGGFLPIRFNNQWGPWLPPQTPADSTTNPQQAICWGLVKNSNPAAKRAVLSDDPAIPANPHQSVEEHVVLQARINMNGQTQTWEFQFWLWVTNGTPGFHAGNLTLLPPNPN